MASGFPRSPPSRPLESVDTENTPDTGSADIDDTQSLFTCALPPSYRTRSSYPDLSEEYSQSDHLSPSSATGQPCSSGLDPPPYASSVRSHAHHSNKDSEVDLSRSLHVTHRKLSVESPLVMSLMEMRTRGGPLGKLHTEGGARPPPYDAELGPVDTHY